MFIVFFRSRQTKELDATHLADVYNALPDPVNNRSDVPEHAQVHAVQVYDGR